MHRDAGIRSGLVKPRDERDSLLAELARMASGVHRGMAAFDDRLHELAGGIPSRGDGGGGSGSVSRPVEAMVVARSEGHQPDPLTAIRNRFDVRLARAHREMLELWTLYASVAPRLGVEKSSDPGCELCAQVEGHWCPVYGAVEIKEPPKRKGGKEVVRVLKLCESCYRFNLPSRAGRLPTFDEVVAHSEGRRPRWTKGA